MQALHTAATGMAAQELNVQVISNNIANLRTTGFKKQTAAFQDLIYEHVRRVGAQAFLRRSAFGALTGCAAFRFVLCHGRRARISQRGRKSEGSRQ